MLGITAHRQSVVFAVRPPRSKIIFLRRGESNINGKALQAVTENDIELSKIQADDVPEAIADMALLLLDLARIGDGEPLADPVEFASRLAAVMGGVHGKGLRGALSPRALR